MNELSYETSIAPYASRFFDRIGGDTRLSPASQARLQSTLLTSVADIEKQRADLREQRDRATLDRQRIEENRIAMQDAADRRRRIAAAEETANAVGDEITGIVNADATPDEKYAALNELELRRSRESAAIPDLAQRFNIARGALPSVKPILTPTQRIEMISEGVDPRVAGSGDETLIGTALGMAKEARTARAAAKDKAEKAAAEKAKLVNDLLSTEPKFDYEDETDPAAKKWLKPEVHSRYDLLVESFGTPQEKAEWKAPRTDDSRHAAIALTIQNRELRKRLGGGFDARSLVTPVR